MTMSFTLKSLKPTSVAILFFLLFLSLQQILTEGHGGIDDGDEPADNSNVNLHSKKLIAVKLWCLAIFFVSTFAFGVSPYFLRWNESFLVLGTQFAGGVFLGTSMMHFLSDSTSTFKGLTSIEYPFSFMLACAGYLLTMFADCVIAYVATRSSGVNRVEIEQGTTDSDHKADDLENREGRHLQHAPIFVKTTSFGDTILLITALCFHSIFEGIAVGIAGNEADAWKNLWTILHKVFAAVAMGIALLKILPKRPLLVTAIYSFAFAISSPIGVGIGMGIDATAEGRIADWTYAIAMGFGCGIFVYVAICHLIAKGYKPQSPCYFDTPFYKFSAVFLGVGLIAIVMIWD